MHAAPWEESSNLQKGEEEVENSFRAEGLGGASLAPWRVSDGLLNVSSDEVKDVSLCLWPSFNQAPAGPLARAEASPARNWPVI